MVEIEAWTAPLAAQGGDPREPEPGPSEPPAPIGDPSEDPTPTGDPAIQDPTTPSEAPVVA